MKLLGIFRFEVGYQLRRAWPWLAFLIVLAFAFENTRAGILPVTLPQDFILNSPFIITAVTVISCLVWLLVASPLAGEAATRDLYTGMSPLVYSLPVTKTQYLGGRFLAAFALNAFVLLGVQAGSILGVYAGGVDPEIIGPFRPEAYLAAYAFVALPNAFIASTMQFTIALASKRTLASYFGSLMLLFFTFPVPFMLYFLAGEPGLAKLVDPIGFIAIMNEMMSEWTIAEKNTRMFTLHGAMLWNRLLWLAVAWMTLFALYARFRFAGDTAVGRKRAEATDPSVEREPVPAMPAQRPPQSFGWTTQLRQAAAIAGTSFRMLAFSPAGLFMLAAFPALLVLITVVQSQQWGVPIIPRTGYILSKYLTAPITQATDYRLMVPLLIVFFAGELVWRERDAGLHEKMDATPVPDRVLLLGKLAGLSLLLCAYLVSVMLAGAAAQLIRGHYDVQPALYFRILFGLQLPELLLFAVLAMVLQVVINQKYLALLASLVAYLLIVFPAFGIEHNLLIYSASPSWTYTDMRDFADSVGPWLWFKLYWAAWALVIGLVMRLLWVRGLETGLRMRARMGQTRLRPIVAATAIGALIVVVACGGFVFYNTNVRNEYISSREKTARQAEYELRYGHYEGRPQPEKTATRLQIDIDPDRRAASLRGEYRLVNRTALPIDTIHIEPAFYADTRITFDRPFRQVSSDRKLGHDIYALDAPLAPGDSMVLSFEVDIARRGFSNGGQNRSGAGMGVVENGTFLTSGALPVIGYQPARELWSAADRRKYGLPRQVTLAAPSDISPTVTAVPPARFEAVVGTRGDQVAVAPGELRRTWTENGRRYFHYVSDVPISGMDVFFSARYALHREQWKGVDIQLFLHPEHAGHAERVLRSVRTALDYYSAQFGPYPFRYVQIVEQPGNFMGMGVDGSGVITGGEGFFLLDPKGSGFDLMFEVVAHEVGHQWWGMQLRPAFAEGGGVISESLAWYSAMQLVKHEKGREALRRLMNLMRQPSPWPQIRTGLPLLRAMDPWANYRKGPYVMHALSEYIGEDKVNRALRTLVEKKRHTLATTLDMYAELSAVTPDSLKPFLADLFERNVFWALETRSVTATPAENGTWDVTLDVEATKTVADSTGREQPVALDDWIEIGIFAPAEPGEALGRPLYLQKHRLQSGRQQINVRVPARPAHAGADPYSLLDWEEGDNIEPVEVPDTEKPS